MTNDTLCYILYTPQQQDNYYSRLRSKPPKRNYIMYLRKHVNWSKLKSQQ